MWREVATSSTLLSMLVPCTPRLSWGCRKMPRHTEDGVSEQQPAPAPTGCCANRRAGCECGTEAEDEQHQAHLWKLAHQLCLLRLDLRRRLLGAVRGKVRLERGEQAGRGGQAGPGLAPALWFQKLVVCTWAARHSQRCGPRKAIHAPSACRSGTPPPSLEASPAPTAAAARSCVAGGGVTAGKRVGGGGRLPAAASCLRARMRGPCSLSCCSSVLEALGAHMSQGMYTNRNFLPPMAALRLLMVARNASDGLCDRVWRSSAGKVLPYGSAGDSGPNRGRLGIHGALHTRARPTDTRWRPGSWTPAGRQRWRCT